MESLLIPELPLLPEEVCVVPLKSKHETSFDKSNEILRDIFLITTEIQRKYPELYKHLEETPVNIKNSKTLVTKEELNDYLDTLIKQLVVQFNSHDIIGSDLKL